MKKINIILISLILFIGGCSSKNSVEKVDNNESENIMQSGYSALDVSEDNTTVGVEDSNGSIKQVSTEKILELSKFEKKFIIYDLLKSISKRCKALNLTSLEEESIVILKISAYTTTMIMNYLYTGRLKGK